MEALVASLVVTTGLVASAHLIDVATRGNTGAGRTTSAATLAVQKMEQLRSLTWGFDADGAPVGDVTTDVAAMPAGPAGGRGLQPSSPLALEHDVSGYVDHVDMHGATVGRDASSAAGAAFTRRWSIEPLAGGSGDALLLQVRVTPLRERRGPLRGAARLPGEAHLVGVKTRKRP